MTVDLRNGELRPHRREDLLTKIAPVEYGAGAKCPRWLQFLDEVFAPHPDIPDFLQRALGYSLTAETREERLFLCHGTGRNGKGVFLKTVCEVLGDYASTADFSAFLVRKNDGPRDDIANMRRPATGAGRGIERRRATGRRHRKDVDGRRPCSGALAA